MTFQQFLSAKIREARKQARFSQGGLAQALEMALPTVSLWERNLAMPSAQHIWMIAMVTGKPIEWFFPDGSEPIEIPKKRPSGIPDGPVNRPWKSV